MVRRGRVRGGEKLAKLIKKGKQAARRGFPKIEVGFADDRFVVMVAVQNEFGAQFENASIPERPAFRAALPEMNRRVHEYIKKNVRPAHSVLRHGQMITDAQAREIALTARDAVRESYLSFEGEALSETQEARKRGTPGAGRQLIGHRGPRLVEHIHAYIDGERVD